MEVVLDNDDHLRLGRWTGLDKLEVMDARVIVASLGVPAEPNMNRGYGVLIDGDAVVVAAWLPRFRTWVWRLERDEDRNQRVHPSIGEATSLESALVAGLEALQQVRRRTRPEPA